MKETWKPVRKYKGLYEVSDLGNVRSVKTGVRLIPQNNGTGYYQVSLSKNGLSRKKYVHRLVGKAFILNKHKRPCINHINGDKADNCLANLEWVTYKMNTKHAMESGLLVRPVGEKNGRAKLTNRQVSIMKMIRKTMPETTYEKIANFFNINTTTAWKAITGQSWATNNV